MGRNFWTRLWERGLYSSLVGLVYALWNFPFVWHLYVICGLTALSMGFFTGLLDHFLFRTRLRRQPFLIVLFVRTIAYILVISLSILLIFGIYYAILDQITVQMIREEVLDWVFRGNFWQAVVYAFSILLIVQFLTLVSRVLGPNVLFNYLMGRYHQPQEEERIFMFLDLKGSTMIAEQIGPLLWHQFLNDFFFDIAGPVRRSRGEIYQYVGDEVVISWPKKVGLRNLNCIHCFFWLYNRFEKEKLKDKYKKKYGYEPVFKAGYHIGKIIVGEIGDYKRDIVFHGDTINTASRIQVECNHYRRRLLLSHTLLEQLDLGEEYKAEYLTKILLRGKQEEIELYSLDPVDERERVPAVY
ncbi:MAG: adenylate/guanylate cyclase domain-containing protein [Bacteroidota bacterium]